jgi:hypothetical protein
MAECNAAYQAVIDNDELSDAEKEKRQAEHMREYLNYERMSKMIMG